MYNDLFTVFGITIHGYGLMIGLGYIFAVVLTSYRAPKRGLSADAVTDLALLTIVVGFLGAKLLYVIVEFKEFLRSPMSVLGSEGFVVYGGIIAGILSVLLYCRKKKLSFLEYFDLLIPGVALAQGFGRIGCFLAGCCYGRETDSVIGVIFPAGSIAPSGVKLLPTQLFSAAGDFIICIILLVLSRRSKRAGSIGCAYLIMYSIGRFIIELFRNDSRGEIGIFSTSQFVSLFIFLAGVALSIYNAKRSISGSVESNG